MPLRRYEATMVVPCVAGAYTAGDGIANHATTPTDVTIDLSGFTRFHIHRASLGDVVASANVVVTNMDIDLLIFKTDDMPTLVGDNVTDPLTSTERGKAARFPFVAAGWLNPLGAAAAGASCIQEVNPALGIVQGNAFEFGQGETETISLRLQAKAAWTPLAVVNTFTIVLDIDSEV